MRSVWQLFDSFTSSAASRLETGTTLAANELKNSVAISRLSSSSAPTTCGRSTTSRNARPWIVRSGATTSRALPHSSSNSGRTTQRVVPTGTVLRTTTSVPGAQEWATCSAAALRLARLGSFVFSSTGVDTQITAVSTLSRGSRVSTTIDVFTISLNTSSTPGSKMCGRPRDSPATTSRDVSTPKTVNPLRANAALRVSPTYPMPTTPMFLNTQLSPFVRMQSGSTSRCRPRDLYNERNGDLWFGGRPVRPRERAARAPQSG